MMRSIVSRPAYHGLNQYWMSCSCYFGLILRHCYLVDAAAADDGAEVPKCLSDENENADDDSGGDYDWDETD